MNASPASFQPIFWTDLLDASSWYEEQDPGVGRRFEEAVLVAVKLVLERPLAYGVIQAPYRRALVPKFRHKVIFVVEPKSVLFIGVVHGMRDLPRWLKRRQAEEH